MMPLAVDISNWGGPLTSETVAKWQTVGVRKVIVGVDAGHIELARQQAQTIVNGGLLLGAYRFMYWGQTPAVTLEAVRVAMSRLPLSEVWIDFEDTNAPRGKPAAVCAWMRDCMEAAAERWPGKVGIYTAKWWWDSWTGDCSDFKDYPLWVAQYDGCANLNFAPFGRWTDCAMKQYQGTTDFCGYSVDLNCYKENPVDEEARNQIALINLARRWQALIALGQVHVVVREAIALGVPTT